MKLESLSGQWYLTKPEGFWKQNAPAKFRNYKFTDPRIPRDAIIKAAKKHDSGLQGARSSAQYLINLGAAKGKTMARLKQIAGWISTEITKQK